jgi:chorismate mutase
MVVNCSDLEALRAEIDALDQQLIALLGRRFAITRQIGTVKSQLKLASITQDRYQAVVKLWQQYAVQHAISPLLAKQIFDLIHEDVIKEHEEAKAHQDLAPGL